MNYTFLFCFNLALSILNTALGHFEMGGIFLAISAVFLVGEDIKKSVLKT